MTGKTRKSIVKQSIRTRHNNNNNNNNNNNSKRAVAHLAVEQFLKNGLTRNKGKFWRFRVWIRKPAMSMENGQDLKPKHK